MLPESRASAEQQVVPVPGEVAADPSMSGGARIRSLDGLRGLAALAVVLYHLLYVSPDFATALFFGRKSGHLDTWVVDSPLRILWAGPEAVVLFFVLSGYVLARRPLAGKPLVSRRYYPRRVCRLLLPVIGSVVVACLIRMTPHAPVAGASWWVNYAAPGDSASKIVISALAVFGDKAPHLNSVLWSMQWEVWFSLGLVLLLFVLRRWIGEKSDRIGVFGIACLMFSAIVPALLYVHWSEPSIAPLVYLPMFGVGVGLASQEPRLARSTIFQRRRWLGWVALVVCAVGMTIKYPILTWQTRLHLPIRVARSVGDAALLTSSAGLIALAITFGDLQRVLEVRPIRWLGSRSYSLYLTHLPIITALALGLEVTHLSWWFAILVLMSALAMAEIFYRLVERPAINLGHRVGGKPLNAR